MIRTIYSSLPSFKMLQFHDGLNIILAEKTPSASERQTRNRAGKSSIVEIIHFLMGGNVKRGSIFREECLQEFAFGIDFDLGGSPIVAERNSSTKSFLNIVSGEYENWPAKPTFDDKTGKTIISNKLWKYNLGKLMFGLPESDEVYAPTFRPVFSYFARRQSEGGFSNPFLYFSKQTTVDEQVHISFLIGLDWTIPQKWQKIRDQERALKALKNAAKDGAFGEIISSTSDLRTQLTITEDRAERLKFNINEFKILPEYADLEIEASDITRKINQLNDDNTIDRQLIADLEESLYQEIPPSHDQLGKVYEEAGIVLPGIALQRFEEVKNFHESVIENRRSYLSGEIDTASRRIEKRETDIKKHEERRSQIMKILHSHGALDHFAELQQELTRLETEVESLRQRYSTAERIETGKTDLDLERQQLLRRLRQDHSEQEETLKKAILAFERISHSLYEDAGNLVIDKGKNGPYFEVKIHGKRSRGISNMQVFCFDMMLMELCAERGIGPGFLIHDSHLFDGVDERQVAKALKIGVDNAQKYNFQYIVTMNEDAVPESLPSDFDFEKYVIPTRLTDATEGGGLFGIRFG